MTAFESASTRRRVAEQRHDGCRRLEVARLSIVRHRLRSPAGQNRGEAAGAEFPMNRCRCDDRWIFRAPASDSCRRGADGRSGLGATVAQMVALLSTDFIRLVTLTFRIAAPATYLFMQRWLDGFAYRIANQGTPAQHFTACRRRIGSSFHFRTVGKPCSVQCPSREVYGSSIERAPSNRSENAGSVQISAGGDVCAGEDRDPQKGGADFGRPGVDIRRLRRRGLALDCDPP